MLVWLVNGDRRMPPEVLQTIADPETSLHVSAVSAYEYVDLQLGGRLPVTESLDELAERFDLVFEALPAECWRIVAGLPPIHRDPVDRMLIGHALAERWTLASADANVRRYPVPCI
jgi:PIN domain nuclease of toxin-antitoxin system